jgi:hypothetical protein
VADYALRGERSWAALTHPFTGAVTDTIAPGPHAVRDYNYGTFLLADAQLRTGDSALADTPVAHVLGLINRNAGRPPGVLAAAADLGAMRASQNGPAGRTRLARFRRASDGPARARARDVRGRHDAGRPRAATAARPPDRRSLLVE